LTLTFENVARSLSNHIRDIGGAETPGEWQGETTIWTTLIKIQWPFLTIPLLTLATSILYIALVIWDTHRLRLPTWKEDLFPVLGYGFEEEFQHLLRNADQSGNASKAENLITISFSDYGRQELRLRPTRTTLARMA
jgi:hypothetical protein